MKKYIPVVLALVLGSAYSRPVAADVGGALPNTPDSAAKMPVADAVQKDVNGVPTLRVEFQTSHAEIGGSYSQNLRDFGNYLKNNPGSKAEIAGYADHTGAGPANGALAQKRADAVKTYLVDRCGVASDRITAAGYGQVTTKSQNSTDAGKQAVRAAIGTITVAKS